MLQFRAWRGQVRPRPGVGAGGWGLPRMNGRRCSLRAGLPFSPASSCFPSREWVRLPSLYRYGKRSALVSHYSWSNLPKAQWLQTTDVFSYSSEAWEPQMACPQLKSKCQQTVFPGGSGVESVPLPLCPAAGGLLHPLVHSSHDSNICFHCHIFFSYSPISFFPFKDTCDCIRFTQIIQNNLLKTLNIIMSAKFILPRNEAYSQILRVRIVHTLREA